MKQRVCLQIRDDLLAAAVQEASNEVDHRVREHVAECPACRLEFESYRDVDDVVAALKRTPTPSAEHAARARLEDRLTDLRSRLVGYGLLDSPLGRILVGRTELGVALVRFLGRSRIPEVPGLELVADGSAEIGRLCSQLDDYLGGRSSTLEWELDLRLAKSDFQRSVLETAGRIPYGAVTSYAHLARELGRPRAARAVAQALRHNPVPIVVPCHRVIGADGTLTGYDGKRVGLKQRILDVEGIQTRRKSGDLVVQRGSMYIRDGAYDEYCLPTCGILPQRSLTDLTLFASRDRAEACGLRPCTTCRPDIHPLLS